ncbi:MAG: alpha/beta hydrolase [Chloroflexota bacterium]
MKHFEFDWLGSDDVVFYGQGWEPEAVKAVVCLVHGMGEHSGRYAHVADFFGRLGYALIGFDLRGHGLSGGQRGHLRAFDDHLDDVSVLLDEAARRYPAKPLFLYGHSMGGLVVLNHALRRRPPVLAVIATSAGLRTPFRENHVLVAMDKLLASVFGSMTIPTGLDPHLLSRDPEVVMAYEADPLVHGLATLSMAKQSFAAIDYALAHAAEFPLPLLLVHGTADSLVFARGSEEFAARTPRATLKLWDGLYHEVHNEPEKETVLADIARWMDGQLKPDS